MSYCGSKDDSFRVCDVIVWPLSCKIYGAKRGHFAGLNMSLYVPYRGCKICKAKRCQCTGLTGHFAGPNRSLCGFDDVILGSLGSIFGVKRCPFTGRRPSFADLKLSFSGPYIRCKIYPVKRCHFTGLHSFQRQMRQPNWLIYY